VLAGLRIFWQRFYCPRQRCETCFTKDWWSMGQCGGSGCCSWLVDCEAVSRDLRALWRFQLMNQALTRSLK
jgi:hypothetical protein